MTRVGFTVAIGFFLWIPNAHPADLAARDIVDKAIHLDQGRSTRAEIRIRVVEENGKTKERKMLLRKKTVNGLDRGRSDFLAPPDIKGLALLIVDRENGETDQHLYTPALRRVRRIRGSLKSQEFADTDFSYEDMERKNVDHYDHALKGEEPIDGKPCYVVSSVTKKKVRSQYARTVAWIDKETFLLKKMEMVDHKGERIKTLFSRKAELISGAWTQLKLEMENPSKRRKTIYEIETIRYDVELDDNLFVSTSLGQ